MATPSRLLGSLLFVLVFALGCISAVYGQTNPPPADPHELVTREPRILSKPAERSAALDLLGRARNNFNLRDAEVPYALKVSFETNGATMNEGSGTMEEFYDGHSQFRWTAGLGDVKVTRVYGTNPSEPIPLRIQLIRSALLRPCCVTSESSRFVRPMWCTTASR